LRQAREHLAHEANAVTGYLFTSVRGCFACMTRLARVVIPGLPHHVTQRGNRREAIFFKDGDQKIYPRLVRRCDRCATAGDAHPTHSLRRAPFVRALGDEQDACVKRTWRLIAGID
jgi:hypothetical protein